MLVGRDFPPYEKTHVRISVGTMAEMQKAVQVFEQVLAQPAKAARLGHETSRAAGRRTRPATRP